MLTGNNVSIQVVTDIIDRETEKSFITNVAKIEKLQPRILHCDNKFEYSTNYYVLMYSECIVQARSSNKIITTLYSLDKQQSILKQVIISQKTFPYDVIYYVEFDNGLKFEMHQDAELLCKINDKYVNLKLKDIAVGTVIATLSGLNCKLSMKISKRELKSQTTLYSLTGVPDEYYYGVLNCTSTINDPILIRS